MKKIVKKLSVIFAGAISGISLSACAGIGKQLDVVGNKSVTSFGVVLETMDDKVTTDEINGGWSLSAPDDTARFIWSKDYRSTPLYDIMLEFNAQPFLDAGLDTSKLPENITFYDNMLMVGKNLGEDKLKYSNEVTALSSYEQIVNLYRDTIGYHTALDHYGVNVGEGNLFEWAKDMNKNDKDMVFVLNPQPFIDAGVDPNAVKGWVFAKVSVDVDGKPTEVDKLLKPFNLK
ncbi:MAG: hypothetical protein PHY47_08605 [Lachnospiraceae bacterium]|nr:hypothetical protein [Lachnospiraceae bacterium]